MTTIGNGQPRPVRVLIIMSDTGGGHRSVAQAVEAGLRRVAGDDVEISIDDAFWQPPVTIPDRLTRLYAPIIRYWPGLYGFLFHLTNNPRLYQSVFRRLGTGILPKLKRLIEKRHPDVIVCVHPLANRLIVRALRELNRPTPVVAVVTELVTVHTSWVDPGITLTTTTNPVTHAAVLRMGADPARVRLLGLPVGDRFGNVEESPAEIRRSLGLDPDRFTALLIGGGEGAGSLVPMVKAIDAAGLPVQLIVVCGRNQSVQRTLERLPLRVRRAILGFVRTIPELMHAADVVLTKTGPQTIAEALASSRPVLLIQTMPGQEEGNAAWIEEAGAGYLADKPDRLVSLLRHLAADPLRVAELARRAAALSQPDAAGHIADAILEVAAAHQLRTPTPVPKAR